MRICVISEALRSPFDEGVKIFVYNLIKELSKTFVVLGLSRTDDFTGDIEKLCLKALPKNKLFLSIHLKEIIRGFKPDIVYYLPTAHATLNSFLRAKVLKFYGKKARIIMVTLQPRKYSQIARKIIPFLVPDLVLAQSDKTYQELIGLGCRTEKITCGVDLEKFVPVRKEEKESLKIKYAIPVNKYVVLHVGHINKNRNAQYMENIHSMDGVQSVVVGSTSYPQDKELLRGMRGKGIIVFTDYIEHIQEIYQCADCYVFPVLSDGACIEIPLSIFEALACDLPVVTTKFGGLPDLLPEQKGFIYVENVDEIPTKINILRGGGNSGTRHIAEQYSWKNIANQAVLASKIL